MQKSSITFFVKDFGTKGKSNFSFKFTQTMKNAGLDIGHDDILMNFIKENDLAIDGPKPWRRARKKDPWFIQLLLDLICTF